MSSTGERATESLPELLNVAQVASYLGLHRATVIAFARRGKLPAFKVGREWRFRADEIRAWVEDQGRAREEFVEKFDQLWKRIRRQAQRSGCQAGDVSRLIEEVRTARERRASPRV